MDPTRRLPLFPLPLVLVPDGTQALHIFEPRYRRMVADCVATGGEFGIVARPPDVAERDLPAGHVGCAARIETLEPLDDGRYNLVARGTWRFALQRIVDDPAPYLVGAVAPYEDEAVVEGDADLEALAGRVAALFARVAHAAAALQDDRAEPGDLPADPARLSFAIAQRLELELPVRLRLLATRSARTRLRDLEAVLAGTVEGLERRAALHRRARTNGHGHHP